MKITSGKYNVLFSGSVFSYNEESITFTLADDFIITVSFKTDTENIKQEIIFKEIANGHIEAICVNFNNTLGTGNTKPIPLGTLNNKNISLNLWVFKLSGESINRKVEYTWYEEMING